MSNLTGGSQMVTKSLSDFCRFFKEAFSNKINNKFGFLVKKYLEIVFEVWNLTHIWPKYRQKNVFLRFWPKIGLFIKYRIFLTRMKFFLQFFFLKWAEFSEFWVLFLIRLLLRAEKWYLKSQKWPFFPVCMS